MPLSSPRAEFITRCQPWLGTFVEVTVPPAHAGAVTHAFAAIAHVHRCMSFHAPDSDLASIRAAAPGDSVRLDPQTVAVLARAQDIHHASDGLFDVCVGRALVAAGFLPGDGLDEPEAYMGTSADIEILDETTVRLHARMLVDLGGIAKGYAVDRAVAALAEAGVSEGLVNAGGDLRAFGGRAWPILLRDADGALRHMLRVTDGAVASSANLLNRHRLGDAEHGPHIGRGGSSILCDRRVTVLAGDCLTADAMTKLAIADPALAWKVLPRYGAGLVTDDMLENI